VERPTRKRSSWGTVSALPSGRFRAACTVEGIRYAAPHTFGDESGARAWLAQERRLIDSGRWMPPAQRGAARCGGAASGPITTVRALGAALVQARRDAGLTQAQVAGLAKVSRRWLVQAEAGDAPGVAVGSVLRVLKVLGRGLSVAPWSPPQTSVHDLMRDEEA